MRLGHRARAIEQAVRRADFGQGHNEAFEIIVLVRAILGIVMRWARNQVVLCRLRR